MRAGTGYVTGGGEWNGGGGITVVVRIFERGGATVVCGAWTTDIQPVMDMGVNDEVIETGSIYAGGTRLVMNLNFMARVPYANNITGEQAECVASPVPWRAEFADTGPRVRIPRAVFHGDGRDEAGCCGGSPTLVPQPTRPERVP